MNFGSYMNLKDASITLAAEQNVTVDSTASILANSATLSTSLGATTINGTINSHFAQIYAGTLLTVNGSIAADSIFGFGNTGTISESFTGRKRDLTDSAAIFPHQCGLAFCFPPPKSCGYDWGRDQPRRGNFRRR